MLAHLLVGVRAVEVYSAVGVVSQLHEADAMHRWSTASSDTHMHIHTRRPDGTRFNDNAATTVPCRLYQNSFRHQQHHRICFMTLQRQSLSTHPRSSLGRSDPSCSCVDVTNDGDRHGPTTHAHQIPRSSMLRTRSTSGRSVALAASCSQMRSPKEIPAARRQLA